MTPVLLRPDSPLYRRIKQYKKRMAGIAAVLTKKPEDWGRFQSEFNHEIQGIFREIMAYEKEQAGIFREDKVFSLKSFFINKLRREFLHGDLIRMSCEKPFGYAGDYLMIDAVLQNDPRSAGVDRLFDNYFLTSAFSVAVRNRKEDFKRLILNFLKKNPGREIRILDLASGPGRIEAEILPLIDKSRFVEFHCCDQEPAAAEYAKRLIYPDTRTYFFRHSPVRIAVKQDVEQLLCQSYDLIFSAGAFEYLDDAMSVRLLKNLKRLLRPGGLMMLSDVRDKFSNPSMHFMEWVADWNLVYRDDESFRTLFVQAGFLPAMLSYGYEQQGLMQYVVVQNPVPAEMPGSRKEKGLAWSSALSY